MALLALYHMDGIPPYDLPRGKVYTPVPERMQTDARKGRSLTYAPSGAAPDAWNKEAKGSIYKMAWCEYSRLWWNRACIQLAGQALTEVQTLSLGELFARWRHARGAHR